MDPLGWRRAAKLKAGTDFNSSLLGAGTTEAKPMLLSFPVIVDPAAPDSSRVVVEQSAVVSATGQVKVATPHIGPCGRYYAIQAVILRWGENQRGMGR